MKFRNRTRPDYSARDATYGHLVDWIVDDDLLNELLTGVLRYRYGVRSRKIPDGRQQYCELVTRWSRECAEMTICDTLLKLLRNRFPHAKLVMLGAEDFKCVLVDGKPVLLLPMEYDEKPFEIHIDDAVLIVTADRVEMREEARVTKTGNGLAVIGTHFHAVLSEARRNGDFCRRLNQ